MALRAQLLAEIDPDRIKALKKKLIDDELTYRAWLEQRIQEYLAGRAPRGDDQ